MVFRRCCAAALGVFVTLLDGCTFSAHVTGLERVASGTRDVDWPEVLIVRFSTDIELYRYTKDLSLQFDILGPDEALLSWHRPGRVYFDINEAPWNKRIRFGVVPRYCYVAHFNAAELRQLLVENPTKNLYWRVRLVSKSPSWFWRTADVIPVDRERLRRVLAEAPK